MFLDPLIALLQVLMFIINSFAVYWLIHMGINLIESKAGVIGLPEDLNRYESDPEQNEDVKILFKGVSLKTVKFLVIPYLVSLHILPILSIYFESLAFITCMLLISSACIQMFYLTLKKTKSCLPVIYLLFCAIIISY